MQVEFVGAPSPKAGIAVFLAEGGSLSPAAAALDARMGGAIQRLLGLGRFKGSAGQTQVLAAPAGVEAPFVVLVGLGEGAPTDLALETAAGHAYQALKASGAEALAYECRDLSPAQAARAGFAARLAAYRFAKYRTKDKPEAQPSIRKVEVVTADAEAARAAYAPLSAVADGVLLARDLVSEPAERPLSGELRRALPRADPARPRGRGAGRGGDGGAGHAHPAGRGPRQHQGEPARGHALERRGRKGRRAAGLRRQGRHLRHGRHLAQAGRRHGGHEVRHGRGRGRDRRARRARRAQGQGRRGGRPGPGREHAGRRRRSGPATSSCRCRARRWR